MFSHSTAARTHPHQVKNFRNIKFHTCCASAKYTHWKIFIVYNTKPYAYINIQHTKHINVFYKYFVLLVGCTTHTHTVVDDGGF